MPSSKFFVNLHLPGPGRYDLVSTDADVAYYHALQKKVFADEEKRKQEETKRWVEMGLPESAVNGMRRRHVDSAITSYADSVF